jgi:excisionase family DNA binding protein
VSQYPDTYTARELASEILHVQEPTVQRWARDGLIPGSFKAGSLWRFDKSEVVAWIAAGGAARAKAAEGVGA